VTQDTRKRYHEQLDGVRQQIVHLGELTTETVPRATEILLANDLTGAQVLIDDDDEIDAISLEVEEQCYQLLALQQPMAGDLRAIVTAIHLVAELERSADLMVNVAKGSRRIYPIGFPPALRSLIHQMSEEAIRLVRLAVEAYGDGNAALGAALDDMDDRLDELHSAYIQAVFECHGEHDFEVEAAVQLALIGRFFERVGDHAVNIGHRVQYMVTGGQSDLADVG
jgi:phosphate transport system protein